MRGMTVVSRKTLTIALRNPLSLSMQVVRTLNLRLALSFLNVCMPNNSLWSRYISYKCYALYSSNIFSNRLYSFWYFSTLSRSFSVAWGMRVISILCRRSFNLTLMAKRCPQKRFVYVFLSEAVWEFIRSRASSISSHSCFVNL